MSSYTDKAQKFEEKSVKKEKNDPYEPDDSKIEEWEVFPDSTTATTTSFEISHPLIDSEQQEQQQQPMNLTQSSSGQSEQANAKKSLNKRKKVSSKNYFGISVVVVVVAIFIAWRFLQPTPAPAPPPTPPLPPIPTVNSLCDLKNNPNNRHFNRYYGIVRNPFTAFSAEQQNGTEPFFELMFTEPMKAPSIILLAIFGAGKTHIRNYRLAQLTADTHIVVNLTGNDAFFNGYLQSYLENVKKQADENIDEDRLFSDYFNSKDFLNIMITELVARIQHEFDKSHPFWFDWNLELKEVQEKFRIECLLNFYSKKSEQKNQVIKDVSVDKEITPIQNLYGNVRIFNKEQIEVNTINLARLARKRNLSPVDFLRQTDKPDLVLNQLAEFLRIHLKKRIVFVVDSLDESKFFFGSNDAKENKTKTKALQAFVDAIATTEVLAMALGQNQIFDIMIFLPHVDGIKVDKWTRTDKIPVVNLTWELNMLSNYADFMLSEMSKQDALRCKPIPTSFEELLGGAENEQLALEGLRQPRDLHRFMHKLMNIMNANAKQKQVPFIATEKEIRLAKSQLNSDIRN